MYVSEINKVTVRKVLTCPSSVRLIKPDVQCNLAIRTWPFSFPDHIRVSAWVFVQIEILVGSVICDFELDCSVVRVVDVQNLSPEVREGALCEIFDQILLASCRSIVGCQ
jgi:hypothetical protein